VEKDIAVNAFKSFKEKVIKNWKAVVVGLSALIFANLFYIKQSIINDESFVNETPVFRTYKTIGNTFYQKKESKKWLFLSGEEILSAGSEIQTDAASHAILSFVGQSGRIELAQKTHVEILKDNKDTIVDFKKG